MLIISLLISRRKRQQTGLPFTTQSIQQCHRRVRQVCFIGATPSSPLAACLKTSFSRLDPIPRGQATVIRSFIRRYPKAANNKRSRVTSFLPPSSPSFVSGRLDHPRHHWNWARTPDQTQKGKTRHLEASRSIFSSQCMQNRHRAISRCKLLFLQKTILSLTRRRRSAGAPNDWRRALRLRSKLRYRQSQHQSIWWS